MLLVSCIPIPLYFYMKWLSIPILLLIVVNASELSLMESKYNHQDCQTIKKNHPDMNIVCQDESNKPSKPNKPKDIPKDIPNPSSNNKNNNAKNDNDILKEGLMEGITGMDTTKDGDNFSSDIDAAIKSIENLKNSNNDLFGLTPSNNKPTIPSTVNVPKPDMNIQSNPINSASPNNNNDKSELIKQ